MLHYRQIADDLHVMDIEISIADQQMHELNIHQSKERKFS